jgi:DNA-binding NarL/FixJ family response regulator
VTRAAAPDRRGARFATFSAEGGEFAVVAFPIASESPDVLTSAERAVLAAILEGLRNDAIARRRRTSLRTVANQVASIFRKLGVRSRGELLAETRRAIAASPKK